MSRSDSKEGAESLAWPYDLIFQLAPIPVTLALDRVSVSGANIAADCLAEDFRKNLSLAPEEPLITGRDLWMPAVMAAYGRWPQLPGENFWYQISTGSAAHPDPAEALVQGILEVIERDAVALTWVAKTAASRDRHRDSLLGGS